MKRRQFIAILGAGAAWPLVARAQQTKRIFKIGHLESGLPSSGPYLLSAFQQGLRKLQLVPRRHLPLLRRRQQFRLCSLEAATRSK